MHITFNADIPVELLTSVVADENLQSVIDDYYDALLSCVTNCSLNTLPLKVHGSCCEDYVVPGWNEFVMDKHRIAREAFLCWAALGKPRRGRELLLMQQCTASFKLALRYCQQHFEQLHNSVNVNAARDSFLKRIGTCHDDDDQQHFAITVQDVADSCKKLKCGPMPNVMVALPNIGGAFCSTLQSLADAHY